jgi:hypothetical protein
VVSLAPPLAERARKSGLWPTVPLVAPARRILRRDRTVKRVRLAKAAIAGNHVRSAIFDRIVLAIPFNEAAANLHDGAPRRMAIGLCEARRNIGARDHRECSD